MPYPDICIAGAGIIGLSLALELHQRGLQVTIVEKGHPLAEASTAAAGMLAAADPGNPPPLRPLSELSLTLYPAFLDRLLTLSGIHVPFQTLATIQEYLEEPLPSPNTLTSSRIDQLLPGNNLGDRSFYLLEEHSIDPRQLAAALLSAVQASSIRLITNTSILAANSVGAADRDIDLCRNNPNRDLRRLLRSLVFQWYSPRRAGQGTDARRRAS
jgi:glycine oxidase